MLTCGSWEIYRDEQERINKSDCGSQSGKLRKFMLKNMIKRTAGRAGLYLEVTGYNLKIIFANKFIFFLLGAVVFYLLITVIDLLNPETYFSEADLYNLLLFPGLLIIFYPSAFGIQNDVDTRMIEVLFGIPDYRYKVWFVRLVNIFILVYLILLSLTFLSSVALIPVPVFSFTLQLMFPVFFMGAFGFMLSTVIRNGNGTAAVLVLIGLVFWISSGILGENEWNIFLNPYRFPDTLTQTMWQEMLFYNRLYLTVGIALALLAGLFRLQKREKYV